jgi:hypothetical protein
MMLNSMIILAFYNKIYSFYCCVILYKKHLNDVIERVLLGPITC